MSHRSSDRSKPSHRESESTHTSDRRSSNKHSKDGLPDTMKHKRNTSVDITGGKDRKKNKEILHRALDDLQDAVDVASEVIVNLEETFKQETSQIGSYASEKVIDRLWVAKYKLVTEEGIPSTTESKDEYSQAGSKEVGIKELRKELRHGLKVALEASKSAEDSRDLYEKLCKHYDDIGKFIMDMPNQYSGVKKLRTEVALLTTLLGGEGYGVCDKDRRRECQIGRAASKKQKSEGFQSDEQYDNVEEDFRSLQVELKGFNFAPDAEFGDGYGGNKFGAEDV